MKIIKANSLPIPLGKQGENNAIGVEFGLCEYLALYGPGTPQLIVQRNGDDHPYPVPLSIDGETAIWRVSDADTSVPGYGQAELRWVVGDVIAKSRIYTFFVLDSLGEASTPPEMWQSWLGEILGAAADVQATVGNAVPYIDEQTYTWHVWSVAESRYIDTGICAKGEKGDGGSGDITQIKTDNTLTVKDGVLGVNTADVVEEDNTLPVTSAAVHIVVGNIGAILDTI